MDDAAPDDLPSAPDDTPDRIGTCCPACGGLGWTPQPVLALGCAHARAYARPCPWCDDGQLTGIVPPV